MSIPPKTGSVQFQFHVAPSEALVLMTAVAIDFGLVSVAEQFFPAYEASIAPAGDLVAASAGLERVNRVALCPRAPELGATPVDFAERNPECLYLHVGSRTHGGLRESALGGRTADAQTLRSWRRVIRRLQAGMHKGAVVRNPHFGAVAHSPAHRHTSGAHALADSGVTMLAIAGWNEFVFDDLGGD